MPPSSQNYPLDAKTIYHFSPAVTCNTPIIVYCISCNHCGKQYVGETHRPFKNRFSKHRGCVNRKEVKKATGHKGYENQDCRTSLKSLRLQRLLDLSLKFLGLSRPYWVLLGPSGSFWVLLGPSESFCFRSRKMFMRDIFFRKQ